MRIPKHLALRVPRPQDVLGLGSSLRAPQWFVCVLQPDVGPQGDGDVKSILAVQTPEEALGSAAILDRKCTSKDILRQGVVLKHMDSLQKSLCPVVICPYLCRSDLRSRHVEIPASEFGTFKSLK